jgi:signal transduction histidine kinase
MNLPFLSWRYGISIALVALALGLTLAVPPLAEAPYCLFFGAAVFSAWRGGLGPGLLATALSALALDFFFLDPIYSLRTTLAGGVRLTAFVLVAVLVTALHVQRRRLEESLQRHDGLRGEHLAVVAQEMRSVLAPMTSALEVLRTLAARPDVAARSRDLLTRQVGRMTRLIDDLLDAASAEQGKLKLSRQPIDLRSVVTSAVELLRPDIEGCGHRMEVCLLATPAVVDGDPARLQQVVVNLLTNAAKYTNPGGEIHLSVEQVASEAWVRVRDTGVGLTAEALAGVFALFAQVDGSPQGGLGIGLSLARQLARLHGGDITVSSAGPGKGCEFVLHLPVQPAGGSSGDQGPTNLGATGPHHAVAASPPSGEENAPR